MIDGVALCESISVSPCPGKCLMTAIIPLSCKPLTYSRAKRLTLYLSCPKLLIFITGLFGLILTSTTGAKLICIPILLHCSAITSAISLTKWYLLLGKAPKVIAIGNVSASVNRIFIPHSPSIAISKGILLCWSYILLSLTSSF